MFKNLLLVVVTSLTLFSCSQKSCDKNAKHNEEEIAVEKVAVTPNDEAKLAISGMVCEIGCAGLIEKELNDMAGVAVADVVYEDSTATVSFDNNVVTKDEIISMVNSIANHQYSATVLSETSAE